VLETSKCPPDLGVVETSKWPPDPGVVENSKWPPDPGVQGNRNLALYQARGGGTQCESSLSAVSLRPCGPLALILVKGKKNEIGGKIRTEK
jgi:hypothetical protein